MSTVAVVAHAGKTLGGGLLELRRELERQGVSDPLWYEVPKSRKAPAQVQSSALDEGAELLFVWGGDGMVQRCIDALDGADGRARDHACRHGEPLRVEPRDPAGHRAGGARSACNGPRRKLDVGRMNGERFAVMAGAGFDAQMIREADAGLKDRIGRVAYVWTGVNQLGRKPFEATIKVDGSTWFEGQGEQRPPRERRRAVRAGSRPSRTRSPDDGVLELGVVTADSAPRMGADHRAHRGGIVERVSVRPASRRRARPRSSSTARSCTSSTAASARR